MPKYLKQSIALIILLICALPLMAHAANPTPTPVAIDADVAGLFDLVRSWYNGLLLPIGSVLSGLVIIYGGILYSVSGGEPAKIQKGKEYIIGAISGEVLLLCVYLIIIQVVG